MIRIIAEEPESPGIISREVIELIKGIVEQLDKISDRVAECFPFELIEELRLEFLK